MVISLERLYTTEAGFNVQAATPLQRAVCRVSQGVPVAELADHPDVIAGFGGADAVAALPVGSAPPELHIVGPSRSGKSKLMAADAIVSGQSVDVSNTDVGDIIRVSILGWTTRTNAVWTHLCETVYARPLLRALVVGDINDTSFALRHPKGPTIEYMRIPVDKWGGSIVSVFSAGVYVDEEPRQIGAEDGVKNWNGVHDASADRLLPGAKFFGGGAPWAPQGPIYELVQERFGKPGRDLVIVRGTGPMWNPSWWTPERCAELAERNPTAYRASVLAEFIDRASGLISPSIVKQCTREGPLEIPPTECGRCTAGIDPSDAGDGNAFSLVIIDARRTEDRSDRYRVVLAREWRHVGVAVAIREAAECCQRYGLRVAYTDQFAGGANIALADKHDLTLRKEANTTSSNVESFTNLATLASTGSLEFSPDATLLRDVLGVRKIATTGGFRIDLPRTADGRHADLAAALATALRFSFRPRRTMFEALSEPGAVERFGDAMAQLQPFRGFGHLGGR